MESKRKGMFLRRRKAVSTAGPLGILLINKENILLPLPELVRGEGSRLPMPFQDRNLRNNYIGVMVNKKINASAIAEITTRLAK